MTSRERVLCAFHRGTPDRIPVSPQHWGRIPPDSELAVQLVRETDMMLYAGWACDCFIGSAVPRETETFGNITRTVYHTPQGDLTRVVTRTPVTSACSEFPCKNAEDVFNLLAAPYEPPIEETVQNALRHFFQTKDCLGDEEVVLLELPNALCFPTHMNQRGADEILAISKRLIEEAGPDGFVLSGTASGAYGEQAARNFIALARYVRSQM